MSFLRQFVPLMAEVCGFELCQHTNAFVTTNLFEIPLDKELTANLVESCMRLRELILAVNVIYCGLIEYHTPTDLQQWSEKNSNRQPRLPSQGGIVQ